MSLTKIRICFVLVALVSTLTPGGRAETFTLNLARDAGTRPAFALFAAERDEYPEFGTSASHSLALSSFAGVKISEFGGVSPHGPDIQLAGPLAKLQDDLRALVLAPTEWRGREWGRLGLAVGLVLASSALDEPIHSAVAEGHARGVDRLAKELRPLGQEAGIALFAGVWAFGQATHRPRWVALGQDGLEASLIASGLIAPALKSISGRTRPRHSQFIEEQFGFFSGEQSFPSGEAAQAFALASVLASHSDSRWVQGLAYGVAGLLAVNRIVVDAHWTSDVVAGALIGTAVGRWVVRRRADRIDFDRAGRIKNWAIGPATDPTTGSGYGLAVRVSF